MTQRYHKKKRSRILARVTKDFPILDQMLDVSDDWYPNYPGNQVKASVLLLSTKYMVGDPIDVRIWVEGMDDTAYYKDVQCETYEEVSSSYRHFKSLLIEWSLYVSISKIFVQNFGLECF